VVTDPQINKQTHTQTDRGDYNTLRRSFASAHCNEYTGSGGNVFHRSETVKMTVISYLQVVSSLDRARTLSAAVVVVTVIDVVKLIPLRDYVT